MRVFLLFIAFLFFSHITVLSNINQNADPETFADILISVPVSGPEDANMLIDLGLQIEHNTIYNSKAEGFVSRINLERIQDAGFTVTVIYDETSEKQQPQSVTRKPWYTYNQIHDLMEKWAEEYSAIAKFDTAGFSIQERAVFQMRISGAPDTVPRQRIYLNGSCHGNEKIGSETCMRIMKHLLENYATDQNIKKIVDRTDFVIHPIQNVDGFNYSAKGRRQLSNGKDANRAFGYKFDGKATDGSLPYQWPETKIYLYSMIEAPWYFNFDYHCGIITMYSAGGFGADKDAYNKIKLVYPLGRAQWDYQLRDRAGGYAYAGAYGKCGSMAFLPEICKHYPPESEIEEITQYNLECVLNVMDEIQKGVCGKITNANTGKPVYARITIKNKGSHVLSDPRSGGFFKYIPSPSGTMEVTVFANGFTPETKTVTAVSSGFAIADFPLTPDPKLVYAALSVDVVGVDNSSNIQTTRNCLGLPDNQGFTMQNGFIILDFGPTYFMTDNPGDDITVYSTNNDAYSVSVSNDIDKIIDDEGIKIGQGQGETSFDLSSASVDSARWIRINSNNTSPIIDAVEANPREITTALQHTPGMGWKDKSARVFVSAGHIVLRTFIKKGRYTISVHAINGKNVSLVKTGYAETAGMKTLHLDSFTADGSSLAKGIYVMSIAGINGKNVIKVPVF